MDNYTIADNFSILSKLMDIHGDNSFKAKSFAAAAFNIEKLPVSLAEQPLDKIKSINGIGVSIAQMVIELIQTGTLSLLQDYIQKTPEGILSMMQIKGIGPKKIATIWKEMEIESVGELLYACEENRLANFKGFGTKSQENIKEAIQFFLGAKGSYLYQETEGWVSELIAILRSEFSNDLFAISGSFAMQREIISNICIITTHHTASLSNYFLSKGFQQNSISETELHLVNELNLPIQFINTNKEHFHNCVFQNSCSDQFLDAWQAKTGWKTTDQYLSEQAIFDAFEIPFIPTFQREFPEIIETAIQKKNKPVIKQSDIRSIIHSHSNWSDGAVSLEKMANAAIEKNYEYLVISDHSQSAFYANGLKPDRIYAQHQLIDELNQKLAPFRIFKSIESDILNDGNLDYPDEILETFDLVIASIHSNLKMSEEKAMSRLIRAIENPYTSILGHMTGRLLLSRNGYPVDHQKIIDACFANDVVIELNAHPRRLDIDWRWIATALEKGVLISINPDAHAIEGYEDCKYGVLVAQKAGLTKYQNLSSYSISDFESFLMEQHQKRN